MAVDSGRPVPYAPPSMAHLTTPAARYFTEFVGTYFLVLAIALSVLSGTDMAPVAIGVTLTALVYMGGHISAAHYNPAVTLGFWAQGTLPGRDVLPYIVSQVVGAILAAVTAILVTGHSWAPTPGFGAGLPAVLLAEVLFSFLLMLVILNVAIDPRTDGNPYYGVAIGLVVMGGIFAVGGTSGAVFNPAVGLGPILVDALHGGSWRSLWIYLAAPPAGALLAVGAYRIQAPRSLGL